MTAETRTTRTDAIASIEISKKEGKRILGELKPVINHNAVLPILTCVLIEVGENGIKFAATNLESYFEIEPEISAWQGSHIVCVQHSYLQWFFNKAISENIKITFYKDHKCRLECGVFKTMVWGESADNFPKKPQLDDQELYHSFFSAKDIVPVIRRSLTYVSTDDLRPAMTGVNFRDLNGELIVAATDAHRLIYTKINNYDGKINVIFRTTFCRILGDSFAKLDFELSISQNYVQVVGGTKRLISRLIDARYPKWEDVLLKYTIEMQFRRKEAIQMLDIASGFLNSFTRQIKLQVTKESIRLYETNIDFGIEVEGSIPVVQSTLKDKEQFLFALNARFLMQALTTYPKEEFVKLEHTGTATKAMTLDGSILLMPLMINEAF